MNTVKQLLNVKGEEVWTISGKDSVLEGLELMAEQNIGSLLVMDGEMLGGIFTERDYARKVGKDDRRPAEYLIAEVMSKELVTVGPDQSVNECMKLMTENRIRHLPVLNEHGELVGIVSIGDVVRDMIEELQFFVKQLENYITGLR